MSQPPVNSIASRCAAIAVDEFTSTPETADAWQSLAPAIKRDIKSLLRLKIQRLLDGFTIRPIGRSKPVVTPDEEAALVDDSTRIEQLHTMQEQDTQGEHPVTHRK